MSTERLLNGYTEEHSTSVYDGNFFPYQFIFRLLLIFKKRTYVSIVILMFLYIKILPLLILKIYFETKNGAHMTTTLLIDDDQELGELLSKYLGGEGITVHAAHSAGEGLRRFAETPYDLVILDIMLPDTSGFEVLGRLRKDSGVPIIMLTGRGEEVDRVVGLEKGADDYIPKPFPLRELLARMRAVLRRTSGPLAGGAHPASPGGAAIRVGEVLIDPASRMVSIGQRPIHLTATEFSIVEMLGRNLGGIVERETLMEQALGKGLDFDDYVLNVHMSNLRKKLDGKASIKTIRGRGYLMAAAPARNA